VVELGWVCYIAKMLGMSIENDYMLGISKDETYYNIELRY
jgi:hypothetical protein